MTYSSIKKVGGLTILFSIFSTVAQADVYKLIIEHHLFVPTTIEVSPNQRHQLIVINRDTTPEEFESYELNREKIIAGQSQVTIFLPPLEAGVYPFFGEFNPKTAQGQIIVKGK